MSTTTDIEGFLLNDPKCIHWMITQWLHAEKGAGKKGPWVIVVSGRPNGSASWAKLAGANITFRTAEPAAAGSMVESIRRQIHEAYGADPVCQIRVIGYHDGESRDPGFDRTGSLAPPSLAEQSSLGQMQTMIDRLDRQNTMLTNNQQTMFVQLVTVVGSLAQANATLATARTAGTAASDLGSVGGTLGMLLMLGFWPKIKKHLGVDGGTDQLLQMVRETVGDLLGEEDDDKPAEKNGAPKPAKQLTENSGMTLLGFGYPPAELVRGPQALPAPRAQAAPNAQTATPAAVDEEHVDVAGALARIKAGGQVDELMRVALADPELKAAALKAAGVPPAMASMLNL